MRSTVELARRPDAERDADRHRLDHRHQDLCQRVDRRLPHAQQPSEDHAEHACGGQPCRPDSERRGRNQQHKCRPGDNLIKDLAQRGEDVERHKIAERPRTQPRIADLVQVDLRPLDGDVDRPGQGQVPTLRKVRPAEGKTDGTQRHDHNHACQQVAVLAERRKQLPEAISQAAAEPAAGMINRANARLERPRPAIFCARVRQQPKALVRTRRLNN